MKYNKITLKKANNIFKDYYYKTVEVYNNFEIDFKNNTIVEKNNFAKLINLLIEKNELSKHNNFKPIHNKIFRDRVGKEYNKYLKVLIEKEIIIKNGIYKLGLESFNYKLSTEIYIQSIVKYQLSKKYLMKEKENLINVIDNPIVNIEIQTMKYTKLPSITTVKQQFKKLSYKQFNKGKLYITIKDFCKKNDISLMTNNEFKKYLSDNLLNGKYSVLDFALEKYKRRLEKYKNHKGFFIPFIRNNSRVYNLNLLDTFIRELITIDKEPIKELDCVGLHPNLFSLFLPKLPQEEKNNFQRFVSGDCHKKMSEFLNIDRTIVKTEYLSFFNKAYYMFSTKNKTALKMLELYKTKLPTLYKIIEEIKQNNHKNMAKWLQKKESELISEVMIRLNNENIKVFNVFDAVAVKISDVSRAKIIFNDVIQENNLTTYAK